MINKYEKPLDNQKSMCYNINIKILEDIYMRKYKCIKCNSVIEPDLSICPHCNEIQPVTERAIYIKKKYGMGNIEIVDIPCEKCGCDKSFIMKETDFDFIICTNCSNNVFNNRVKPNTHNIHSKPTVTCPYCKSTNTKKISSMSKAGSVAMWGIFALGKTTKQWHCNNCKSDF